MEDVLRYLAMIGMSIGAAMLVAGTTQDAAGQARVASVDTVDIAPHRAVYVIELGRTRQGGNVTGARGALVMEWEKSCSGWTVKQRLKLDLTDNDGNTIETESNFSSFESGDGLQYRFTTRNTRGGQVTEDLQGSARLAAPGGAGTADFSQPKGTRFDLPKGTLFPTKHMAEVIAAARRGERVVYRTVFDGASLDGPLAVNAVVGRPLLKATGTWAKEPLTNRPSWPMRMAFFPLKESKAEPDYELGMRVFDNAVGDEYELDYGSFTVRATIERIEAIARPKC
jgi:hypothetical protein